MFVPNFKILGQVVAEKSLTKKKFTHTHTQTEKAKTIYPLYTSYTGGIIRVYLLNEGVLTSTHNKREKVYFYLKIFNFYSHKSSSILNRRVNILSDVSRVANKFFNGYM